MRVYICVTPFFPTSESFRGPYIYDQISEIKCSQRYDRVVVLRPGKDNSEYEYQGIKVFYFKTIDFPSNIFPGFFDPINQKSFLRRLDSIGIIPDNITIVHAHIAKQAIYANIIKELNPNTRTIIQYHDPDPYSIRLGYLKNILWHRKFVARNNKKICEKIDLQVCVSKRVLNNLFQFPNAVKNETYAEYRLLLKNMSNCDPINAKDYYVLYNGVDRSRFYPRNKLVSDKFRIGCIANFVDWKDIITLIRSVEILVKEKNQRDVILSLIGSGPLKQNCINYVDFHSLKNWIVFEEEVHHDQLSDFYNSLDLFILPSFFEGFGCVFTEAYACGVPFMSCLHQGIEEYIPLDESHKWLFAPQDFRALAILIEKYRIHNYKQNLALSFDISLLLQNFLNYIDDNHVGND